MKKETADLFTAPPGCQRGGQLLTVPLPAWVKSASRGSADPTLRLTPDFLSMMATSTNVMRLSLQKAAHGAPTGAAWSEIRGNAKDGAPVARGTTNSRMGLSSKLRTRISCCAAFCRLGLG